MYEAFYGFKEKPFNITPDPKYLYLSNKHREAFAHLLYGIKERGGFIIVTGDVGTGKTTLCRFLLNNLDEFTEGAFIFNPNLSATELLKSINQDFGIQSPATSKKELIDELNAFLLQERAKGKNMVLLIDEAQDLDPAVLEQIRLLSNLETDTEKLLQIVLIGQPELREMLARPELRQLSQRVTARYHLTPLHKREACGYILHRIKVAGGQGKVTFTPAALRRVYRYARGTPRLINVLCDRALLAGYASDKRTITGPLVRKAIRDFEGEQRGFWKSMIAKVRMPIKVLVTVAALALALGSTIFGLDRYNSSGKDLASFTSDILRDARGKVFEGVLRFSTGKSGVNAIASSEYEIGVPVIGPMPSDETLSARIVPAEAKEPTDEPMGSPLSLAEAPPEQPALTVADEVAFLSLLESSDERGSLATSASAVLALWDGATPPVSDSGEGSFSNVYELAESHQLRCTKVWANPDKLRVINMPCVLQVSLPSLEGRIRYVALLGLEGDRAVISMSPETSETISLDLLDDFWLRKAFVFWNDFEGLNSRLLLGDVGRQVIWLQDGLRRLGFFDNSSTGLFDDETRDAVLAFQRHYSLVPDGIVGPLTKMMLYAYLGSYSIPRLVQEERGV